MRVFLSLLAPFFLSFAFAQEDYYYSISWEDSTYTCNEEEALLSLDAIEKAVNEVLADNDLTEVTNWSTRVGTGRRDLCENPDQCKSKCADYFHCAELYICDECDLRRQLIQTERVLTHPELQDLQAQLVIACTVALDAEGLLSNGNDNYTTECKAAMIEATCNALVYSPPSFATHSVCENFALHAGLEIFFQGAVTTISGGNVGVSPGTSITGAFEVMDGGEVVYGSTVFAASVLVAHEIYTAVQESESALGIELENPDPYESRTFYPGTYRSDTAINIAHGITITLDGQGDPDSKFLFIAGTTLITAADTEIILINEAKTENVLWALGTAATLGARSVVQGSILAGSAITFGTQSKLHGCALAQTFVNFESEGSIDPIHV
jgi:hypothetical protein